MDIVSKTNHGGPNRNQGRKPSPWGRRRLLSIKCTPAEFERIKRLGVRERAEVLLIELSPEHRDILNADFGSFQSGVEELVKRYCERRNDENRIAQLENALSDILETFDPWHWHWEPPKRKFQCRECGAVGSLDAIAHYQECTLGMGVKVLAGQTTVRSENDPPKNARRVLVYTEHWTIGRYMQARQTDKHKWHLHDGPCNETFKWQELPLEVIK